MGEKNVGAVLIIEENVLEGVLSERDYARKIVLKDKSSAVSDFFPCAMEDITPFSVCSFFFAKAKILMLLV
jgi:hypothetical protein